MQEQKEIPSTGQAGSQERHAAQADELWAQYKSRQSRFGWLTQFGTLLLWLLALIVLLTGLWIVSFR